MAIQDVHQDIAEQARLRRRFDDVRIVYGWNPITHRNEIWYKPANSRPYMIATAVNVCHAIKQLESRSQFEKKRAVDILRSIDEHNERLIDSKRADAMAAIRHDLRSVAAGKQYFISR